MSNLFTIKGEHTTIGDQTLVNNDCIDVLCGFDFDTVDLVVTSPPYNLKVSYGSYTDNLRDEEYLGWTIGWISQVRRVLKKSGSFFLNISGSPSKPMMPFLILEHAVKLGFVLQNNITWVKSISIKSDLSFGHFKPINSKRYLNSTTEHIFHLTRTGDVHLHKTDIGAEYVDSSNLTRWKNKETKRCAGNAWFIPYETRNGEACHPTMFPIEVPNRCIDLHFGKEKKEGIIIDPFMGAGTTLLASARKGHHGIGIEMDKRYYQVSQGLLKKENKN